MTRAEWLASLQTFDKAWIPPRDGMAGRIIQVLVRGDGQVFRLQAPDAGPVESVIQPVPEAPFGHCPACSTPYPWEPLGVRTDCAVCHTPGGEAPTKH